MRVQFLKIAALTTIAALANLHVAAPQPPFGLTEEPPTETVNVGLAGDPSKIRVEGCDAFTASDIRWALTKDLTYQAASRPSGDLLALVDVLESRIADGYRHAGYPEVNVDATYDPAIGALAVKVVEGAPYVAGEIRIEGASDIDASQLATKLQEPLPARVWTYVRGEGGPLESPSEEPERPLWETGKPAPADAQTLSELTRHVEVHLADLGFPFASFEVRVDHRPGEATADLVIAISAEHRRAIVHDIRVNGLTRHTREQLLEHLKISPGMPVDFEVCERAYQALRHSCRFWQYAVVARLSDQPDDRYQVNPQQVDLEITVLEYERVPLLGEPLPEVDRCMVQTAVWLDEFREGKVDDELVYVGPAPYGDGGPKPVELRLVLSPHQGVAATLKSAQPADFSFDHACLLGPKEQEIGDWIAGKRLRTAEPFPAALSLSLSPGEFDDGDYRVSLKFGAGVTSRGTASAAPAPLWRINVEPIALVHTVHRKGIHLSLEENVLVAANENLEINIDRKTGRPIQMRFIGNKGEVGGQAVGEIHTAQGEYDRVRAEILQRSDVLTEATDDVPVFALAEFAMGAALAQPYVEKRPLIRLACARLKRAIEEGDNEPLLGDLRARYRAHDDGESRPAFSIPKPTIRVHDQWYSPWLIYDVPWIADAVFPRGSWPWTWAREWAFVAADNWQKGEFAGNYSDSGYYLEYNRSMLEASLFGRWVMIKFSPSFWNQESAAEVAHIVLNWPEKDFSAELKTLLDGDHGLVGIMTAAVGLVDELNAADRAAARACLGREGQKVLSQLLERRSAHPDETPADALEVVLLETWNSGGSTAIDKSLRATADERQQLPLAADPTPSVSK